MASWNPVSRLINTLMTFLSGAWETMKATWKTLWDFMQRGWLWLTGIIWAFALAIANLVTWVKEQIQTLIDKLAEIVLPSADVQQSVGDFLEVMDIIVPIPEGFVVLSALCVLWLAMLVYRFIKSWIPTVN